jgi:hypothetical protein
MLWCSRQKLVLCSTFSTCRDRWSCVRQQGGPRIRSMTSFSASEEGDRQSNDHPEPAQYPSPSAAKMNANWPARACISAIFLSESDR